MPSFEEHQLPLDTEQSATSGRLTQLARGMALLGGVLFLVIVALVCISVVGRKLFSAPIPGDVEVCSMLAAVAAACCFPWAHFTLSDVKVDFFTNRWRPSVVAALEAFGSLLVAVVAGVIAWRTGIAAVSVFQSEEISAILGWPVWISYAGVVPGFLVLMLTGMQRVISQAAKAVSPIGTGNSAKLDSARGERA